MIGAIVGDIVGSVCEWHNIKTKDFPFFREDCFFTDDTVMTCAVAEAVMDGGTEDDFIDVMKKYGRMYPDAGYGGRFRTWLFSDSCEPYHSFGNGSAMRVSPCGWVADCGFLAQTGIWPERGQTLARLSAEVTHNHPEGIKGALAVADAIFLCRYYFGGYHRDGEASISGDPDECKRRIKEYIEQKYSYDLSRTLDEIRPDYRFDETCQGSVPEAIISFLESTDFEDAIRNAISLGGDSDTIAAITGSIAEAAYGVPDWIQEKALSYLDDNLREVVGLWQKYLSANGPAGEQPASENRFLSGNERIEQAIAAYARGHSQETLWGVIAAIQSRMNEDGHFLIPVEATKEDPNTFTLRTITSEDGKVYFACFTSEEEVHKGPETSLLSHFMDAFLAQAVDAEDIQGIAINPFGTECLLGKLPLQLILDGKKPDENDYLRENRLLEKAIHFAVSRHSGQLRKGTKIPYILHPLEVMGILRSMKADVRLLMAGVLHDTLEDTKTTEDEIMENFGPDVLDLVLSVSEDKTKSWEERKTAALEALSQARRRVQLLAMADKISNLRSLTADYAEAGDTLWARFNAPAPKQSWYYSGVIDALDQRQSDPDAAPLYWEMVGLYKDLFVRYYKGEDCLLQIALHGEAFRLDKGDPRWKPYNGQPDLPSACQLISRQEAERTEDCWNAAQPDPSTDEPEKT